MQYTYDLDPKKFEILTSDVKTVVCNQCEKQTDCYLYCKTDLYCTCMNLLAVSKGSTLRLTNSRLFVKPQIPAPEQTLN